jgi:PPOX class probable F420-dependent enzyme
MPLYVPFQLPDLATPAGKRVARQLHSDLFVWFTTVDEDGTPQSLPVTFLWDEVQATFLIYNRPEAERGRHIRQNPRVALHFDLSGEDVIIITGEASVSSDDPPSDQLPAWVQKYRDLYPRLGQTPQQYAEGAKLHRREL